jgi:predicted nuclease of predicted toxin-antitoxin system
MKLLFDQNISYRLIKKIRHLFPDAVSVKEVGLESSNDFEIWEFAKTHGYTIVTFDADFYELNMLKKQSPKIIWLRIGNTSTDNLVMIFTNKYEIIKDFIMNNDYKDIGCLEID